MEEFKKGMEEGANRPFHVLANERVARLKESISRLRGKVTQQKRGLFQRQAQELFGGHAKDGAEDKLVRELQAGLLGLELDMQNDL